MKTPNSFCFSKKQADKVDSIQSIQRLWLIFSRHIRFGKLGVTTIWLNERKKNTQIQTHKNKLKVILLDFLLSFQLCLADFLQLMTAQSQKPLFKLILRCSPKCNWKLKKNNLVNGPWDKITFQTTLFFFKLSKNKLAVNQYIHHTQTRSNELGSKVWIQAQNII